MKPFKPTMRVRRMVMLVAAFMLCTEAATAQEADPLQRGNRLAYEYAMRCFVVDGSAAGERKDAGDSSKADYYESKARQAFDMALKLGQALGYSGDHISADFGLVQTRELPKLVKSLAYYREAASTCKALGLL